MRPMEHTPMTDEGHASPHGGLRSSFDEALSSLKEDVLGLCALVDGAVPGAG